MTWTLEQLADRAARALVDAEVHVASGRVTGVPDGRLIRWYTTIGLVDRPVIGPGRVARYDIRHLLQLVAVKRLQAQGLPLAKIQHRLAGATEATLRRVAALPPGLDAADDLPVSTDRAVRLHDPSERGDHVDAPAVLRRPSRRAPGRNMPEPATPNEGVSSQDSSDRVLPPTRFWAARPASGPAVADVGLALDTAGDTVTRVSGVLINGLLLVLPAEPADDDLEAIAAAAQPLLDLLAERGLLHRTTEETPREGAPTWRCE